MSKGRNRKVYRRSDGKWANKRVDSDRASSLHTTLREAEAAARSMLKNQGGGELTTMGVNGRIRSKDTIAPGNEPHPPKDNIYKNKAASQTTKRSSPKTTSKIGKIKTKGTGPRKE